MLTRDHGVCCVKKSMRMGLGLVGDAHACTARCACPSTYVCQERRCVHAYIFCSTVKQAPAAYTRRCTMYFGTTGSLTTGVHAFACVRCVLHACMYSLSVKTNRRVATGNTKSREATGALAGTGPSINGPDPGTRRRFRRCRACHLTYTRSGRCERAFDDLPACTNTCKL